MRRYARTLVIILILVVLAAAALSIKTVKIGGFERGSEDTILGLTLGLDLQGGSHLVYQSDLRDLLEQPVEPTADQMEGLRQVIERRINSSGLGEPILQVLGSDRLLVQIPGVSDPDTIKDLIGETAQLEFKHRMTAVAKQIDFEPGEIVGFSVATNATGDPATSTPETTENAESSATSTENTTDSLTASGTTTDSGVEGQIEIPQLEITFSESGKVKFDAIVGELRDSLVPLEGSGAIFPDALLLSVAGGEFPELQIPYQPMAFVPELGQAIPLGGDPLVQEVLDSNKYVVNLVGSMTDTTDPIGQAREQFSIGATLQIGILKGRVDEDIGLTGENLARAYPGQHQGSGIPIINIEFNSEGTKTFAEITSKIAGTSDVLAIFLDAEELIAPGVTQPITGGTAFIQGHDFTIDRVRNISLLLEGGRLPVPIMLIQERDIDAILGKDSLEKSVRAGFIGLALVLLFMMLYYRVPGFMAALALLIYAGLLLTIFKLLPVTLTLAGVAAAILSVGMAVDGNILIFERMKEEIRAGRTLLSSVNIGFNRAWPAIRDSNVSTLITSAILFWFSDTLGATIVQGFAATLAIGVMLSMFSAVVVSRTLLRIVAITAIGKKLAWFVPTEGRKLPQLNAEPDADTA